MFSLVSRQTSPPVFSCLRPVVVLLKGNTTIKVKKTEGTEEFILFGFIDTDLVLQKEKQGLTTLHIFSADVAHQKTT